MPHPQSPEPTTRVSAPRRTRGDRGLTTLEWLLIVAAVAGLAALAVVLVQNVVDDTAEQISQGSARLTAAKVAAQEITDEAKEDIKATTDNTSDKAKELKARCERLQITYGNELKSQTDATKGVVWNTWTDASNPASCKVTGKDE